jgi:hypothetical protein
MARREIKFNGEKVPLRELKEVSSQSIGAELCPVWIGEYYIAIVAGYS